MHPGDPFTLSPHEVAAREGVPAQTIWRLLRQGRIFPAELVGRRWVIGVPYQVALAAPGEWLQPRDLGPKRKAPRVPGRRGGRPKGAKNKRPYPPRRRPQPHP